MQFQRGYKQEGFYNSEDMEFGLGPDFEAPVPADSSKNTVIGCNRRMLDQQLACDVTFKVGQSRSPVGAHKYVLSARSDVFFTMFNGSIPQSDDVDVPDIEIGPFKIFLRYLYCDEVLIDSDNVLSVLYCCKKYNVQPLLTECVGFVKNIKSVDNVCSLLEQAHFFDEKQLYESCLSFIHQQGAQVLQTTGFIQLSRACVFHVISSNSLACEERFVFEAMVRWAEAECKRQKKPVHDSNLREILGDLLFQIRFTLLDMSYYSSNVSTRKILTDAEKVYLFQAISGSAVGTMKFNGEKRTNCWSYPGLSKSRTTTGYDGGLRQRVANSIIFGRAVGTMMFNGEKERTVSNQ